MTIKPSNKNIIGKVDAQVINYYDLRFLLIIEKSDLDSKINYQISTSILSEGVYIVKIFAKDGQTMSQKIIVERKN